MRHRARSVALLIFAGAVSARAESDPGPIATPLLDASHDERLHAVDVPSTAQKVGEVRLVRRGSRDVVQTVLYTKVLSRAVGEIRRKELAAWPESRLGHDDSMRYVAAITAAQKEIWQRLLRDVRTDDRRQSMWIEFILGASDSGVAVGTFRNAPPREGELPDGPRETLATLDLARDYVRTNMRVIAGDSFHAAGPALDTLLDALPQLRTAEDAANRTGRSHDAPSP